MFIVIEGIDGSGKTSVIRELVNLLEKDSQIKIFVTEEPTKTLPIGQYIRKYASDINNERHDVLTESLLFFADRYDHLNKIIIPKLEEKYIVISDRYWYSTFAYQGAQLDVDDYITVAWMDNLAKLTRTPNYAFYLDVSIDTAFERLKNRKPTIFENRIMLEKVKTIYERMARDYILIPIDGELSIKKVASLIFKTINKVEMMK